MVKYSSRKDMSMLDPLPPYLPDGSVIIASMLAEDPGPAVTTIRSEHDLLSWVREQEREHPRPPFIFVGQLRDDRGALVGPQTVMAKLLCGPLRETTVIPLGSKDVAESFLNWCRTDRKAVEELQRKGILVSRPRDLEIALGKRVERK